jgi:hypothetical protein
VGRRSRTRRTKAVLVQPGSELKGLKLPGQGGAATCGREVQDKKNEGNVGAARSLN